MEHAGTAVAAAVKALATDLERWGTGPIVILCGPGNNGGDGYVAARRLALAGASVIVAVVAADGPPTRRGCRPELGPRRAAIRGSSRSTWPSPEMSRCSVSASTRRRSSSTHCSAPACRGALREPIRSAVEVIAGRAAEGVPVVAVDTPTAVDLSSGEPSEPAVQADLTVTFHRPKTGLLTRRGAALCRQGPGRPDRHPGGSGSWLSRAGGRQPGWREVIGRGRGRRGGRPGRGHPDQPAADRIPGGRLPHAARDRRADRRDGVAAVADRAPAAGSAPRG